jgi:hypothetical protein
VRLCSAVAFQILICAFATATLGLHAANCTNPVEATRDANWRTISPPKEDVEVVYSSTVGWIGLNHIYAIQQSMKHRRRILIPWLMPQVMTVFPFAHAIQAPANRVPLFYVDHSDTAAHLSDTIPHELHLVRVASYGKYRSLPTSSGAFAFNFHPGFSANEIPLTVDPLSDGLFAIQPKRSLDNGEYLIFLGPVASAGFEFRVNCP